MGAVLKARAGGVSAGAGGGAVAVASEGAGGAGAGAAAGAGAVAGGVASGAGAGGTTGADAAADELDNTHPWIDQVGARGHRIAVLIRTGA